MDHIHYLIILFILVLNILFFQSYLGHIQVLNLYWSYHIRQHRSNSPSPHSSVDSLDHPVGLGAEGC